MIKYNRISTSFKRKWREKLAYYTHMLFLLDICTSSRRRFYDTNEWWRRLAASLHRIRNDVVTAPLERQIIAGVSLLSRFAR